VTNLLSSLLAQLVQQGSQITTEIKGIYKAWKIRGMYPSHDELLRMIKSQIEPFSKVFIVVDALDECLNDPETNTTDEFLKALRQLPNKVHLLFTSRHDISIGRKVQADSELEIRADSNDLRRYLETRIKSRENLRNLIEKGLDKDKLFLDKALDSIVKRSQGM
jgi:archaellum biogenesis ATPase FlaH